MGVHLLASNGHFLTELIDLFAPFLFLSICRKFRMFELNFNNYTEFIMLKSDRGTSSFHLSAHAHSQYCPIRFLFLTLPLIIQADYVSTFSDIRCETLSWNAEGDPIVPNSMLRNAPIQGHPLPFDALFPDDDEESPMVASSETPIVAAENSSKAPPSSAVATCNADHDPDVGPKKRPRHYT